VWAMFMEILGITYRLRVLRYYNGQQTDRKLV
jgi:hypothetical protein